MSDENPIAIAPDLYRGEKNSGKIQMKTLAILLLLLCSAVPGQQNSPSPPTVAQCVGDVNLWFRELDFTGAEKMSRSVSSLTFGELNQRGREMNTCLKIYSALSKVDKDEMSGFEAVAEAYRLEMLLRYQHFLERHGEEAQFLREDAEGKR